MNFYGDQTVVRPRYKQMTSIPATPSVIKRLNSADRYSNKTDKLQEPLYETFHPSREIMVDQSLSYDLPTESKPDKKKVINMRVVNTSQGYQIKLMDSKAEQQSTMDGSALKRKRVIFAKRRLVPQPQQQKPLFNN